MRWGCNDCRDKAAQRLTRRLYLRHIAHQRRAQVGNAASIALGKVGHLLFDIRRYRVGLEHALARCPSTRRSRTSLVMLRLLLQVPASRRVAHPHWSRPMIV